MNKIVSEDTYSLIKANPSFNKIHSKSILVAGGNSLLARTLTYFLLEANYKWDLKLKITVLVRDTEIGRANYKEYVDRGAVRLLHQNFALPFEYDGEIDWLINSGGASSPYYYMSDPVGIIKANAVGTINLLDLCVLKRPEKIVYFSSKEIYGRTDFESELIDEETLGMLDHTQVRNCYPESKRIAENIHIAYHSQFKLPYTILRLSSVYGPGMRLENDARFMSDIIKSILNKKNIILNSDGTTVRSYCYVTDAIDAIIKILLDDSENHIYNIANEDDPLPVKEIANTAASLFKDRDIAVTMHGYDAESSGYSKVPYEKLDLSRITNLGWSPKIDLCAGIKRTIESFEEG